MRLSEPVSSSIKRPWFLWGIDELVFVKAQYMVHNKGSVNTHFLVSVFLFLLPVDLEDNSRYLSTSMVIVSHDEFLSGQVGNLESSHHFFPWSYKGIINWVWHFDEKLYHMGSYSVIIILVYTNMSYLEIVALKGNKAEKQNFNQEERKKIKHP